MKNILLVVFFALSIVSCDKDEPEAEGTPMERLVGTGEKKWKLVQAMGHGVNGLSVDLIRNEACLKDNELLFKSDGSYVLEDVGEVCSTTSRIEDKWSYSENPQRINLGSIVILGRTLPNVVLDIEELKSSYFSGNINNVPENSYGLQRVTVRFDEVK